MLVVDDAADHHVAHVCVERGGLAKDVHAAKVHRFCDLAQDVVRGEPERVVDVDDHGPARRQCSGIDRQHALITMRGGDPVERDHLRGDVERGTAGDAQRAGVALLAT